MLSQKSNGLTHNATQAMLRAFENHTVYERVDKRRFSTLRVSSFPFCATKWLLNPGRRATKIEVNFQDRFFTSVGTSVHEYVQTAFDTLPNLVRDWQCKACNHRHTFCELPKKCAGCGSVSAGYKGLEHEVRYKDTILGHIDDAIKVKTGIVIIDYKTCSDSKFKSKPGSASGLPLAYNVKQIEAYSHIKKMDGEPIVGWALVYINRNNGARRVEECSTIDHDKVERTLTKYIRHFKLAAAATTKAEIDRVIDLRRRKTEDGGKGLCDYCPHIKACPDEKKIKKLAYTILLR